MADRRTFQRRLHPRPADRRLAGWAYRGYWGYFYKPRSRRRGRRAG